MSQVVRQECGKCEPRRDGGGGDDERCERGCIIVVKRLGAAITSLSLIPTSLTPATILNLSKMLTVYFATEKIHNNDDVGNVSLLLLFLLLLLLLLLVLMVVLTRR